MDTGHFGRFYWVESAESLPLLKVALPLHRGLRLCVTSFDSGPLRPGQEELAAGWASIGEISVSPPITPTLEVPQGEYDEWYILTGSPDISWQPEVFVNYGGFTLVSDETQRGSDRQWLPDMQKRFWAQICATNPVSYIASGGSDVVVSQNREFIDHICSGVAQLPTR
jgi:hypothetical protein